MQMLLVSLTLYDIAWTGSFHHYKSNDTHTCKAYHSHQLLGMHMTSFGKIGEYPEECGMAIPCCSQRHGAGRILTHQTLHASCAFLFVSAGCNRSLPGLLNGPSIIHAQAVLVISSTLLHLQKACNPVTACTFVIMR